LEKEQFRTAVVLRSDGTALYATEDLALVLHKFNDYPDLEKSIYIVDVRQSLHFTQVFKILEIAGYEQAKKCSHVSYELVTLPECGGLIPGRDGGAARGPYPRATARAKEEARRRIPH
jgi:arginyl-tRNA synthetase